MQAKRRGPGPHVWGQKATGRWYVKGRDRVPYIWARIVMWNELGRELRSDEHVHHLNHDKTDDRPENLAIVTAAEHTRLHPEASAKSGAVNRAKAVRLRTEVQRLWAAGQTSKQIAEATGIANVDSMIFRMRAEGWDVPQRHRGWATTR